MFPDHMGGWGWWVTGVLVMLLFWGGVIALAFFLIRAAVRSGTRRDYASPSPQPDSALDILKARYARGEISRDEYLNMRRDLEG
jgi:putative membrane protein